MMWAVSILVLLLGLSLTCFGVVALRAAYEALDDADAMRREARRLVEGEARARD